MSIKRVNIKQVIINIKTGKATRIHTCPTKCLIDNPAVYFKNGKRKHAQRISSPR